jgi:protein SCO1/2
VNWSCLVKSANILCNKYLVFTRIILTISLILVPLFGSQALEQPGENLGNNFIIPQFGGVVDTALKFQNEKGETVSIGDVFRPARPAIIIPAYYHCPRLCGLLLSGAVSVLNQMDLKLGKDYSVVTVSFATDETPDDAASKASLYRGQYRSSEEAVHGWSFLVGKSTSVDPLMRSLGFKYLPDQGEFAHAATMVIVTPERKISKYFNGVTFNHKDLQLALVEASQGSIGTVMDQVLLFCFRFDHSTGKYTWHASLALRLGSVLTVIVLLSLLFYQIRRKDF